MASRECYKLLTGKETEYLTLCGLLGGRKKYLTLTMLSTALRSLASSLELDEGTGDR